MEEKKLQTHIQQLESELAASIAREEALRSSKKSSRFIAMIKNPDSKLGKLFRLPRTLFRLATNKNLRAELRQKNISSSPSINPSVLPFSIDFFVNSSARPRINLILNSLEKTPIKNSIALAMASSCELRVIFTAQSNNPKLFLDYLKKEKLENDINISFYSSFDESIRGDGKFRLEVSDDDIFISSVRNYINDNR